VGIVGGFGEGTEVAISSEANKDGVPTRGRRNRVDQSSLSGSYYTADRLSLAFIRLVLPFT
jgi:hypothetical protein